MSEKNLNVINQNKETGTGKLTIDCNNKTYTIERTSTKYVRRLKGEETLEAKTDLNFEVYDPVTDEVTSLNGNTRNETDANIRKHFGTIDDFMVSSLASQHGALSFIDEGSTRRKEIIAKFLDLEIFEKKFRMAKEDSVETKVMLKKHQDRNYDSEIEECEKLLSDSQDDSAGYSGKLKKTAESKDLTVALLQAVETQIQSAPKELIDIHNLLDQQSKKAISVVSIASKIKEQTEKIDNKIAAVVQLREARKLIDHDKFTSDNKRVDELGAKLTEIQDKLIDINKKQKLLDGIPCGTSFPKCKFIRDANVAVATLEQTQNELSDANLALASLSPDVIRTKLQEHDTLTNSIQSHEKKYYKFRIVARKEQDTQSKNTICVKDDN